MELYICKNCGSQFESFFDLVFDPLTKEYFCPMCKSYDVIEVNEEETTDESSNDNTGGTNEL